MRLWDRARLQPTVVDAVEIAFEGELVLGPQALEHLNKFFRAAVALVMIEPGFAERAKLVLEPARQDVDGEAALRVDVDRRAHLRDHGRVPESGMNGADQFEPLGLGSENRGAGDRLLLQFPAVACDEASRRQPVFEPKLFSRLREAGVVVEAPVGSLRNVADDETAAAERHPVSKANGHDAIPCGRVKRFSAAPWMPAQPGRSRRPDRIP